MPRYGNDGVKRTSYTKEIFQRGYRDGRLVHESCHPMSVDGRKRPSGAQTRDIIMGCPQPKVGIEENT